MNKKAKITIQLLSVPIGVIGAVCMVISIISAVIFCSTFGIISSSLSVVIAVYFVYVFYQIFYKYCIAIIRHVCGIYSCVIVGFLIERWNPIINGLENPFERLTARLLPIAIGLVIYKYSSKMLIGWANDDIRETECIKKEIE